MSEILISLCHTTARVPHGWCAAAETWLKNCDDPSRVEHILTADEELIDAPCVFENTTIAVNHGPKTCVAGWNLAFGLSSGKLIISLADDWFPLPHWDTELLNLIPDLDGQYVLDVDTLRPDPLLTFVIATRAYLNKYNGGAGWMFYPEYVSMYCDNDFSDSARLIDKVVINARHLTFPHYHPSYFAGIEADPIHVRQGRPEAWRSGIKVYKFRCREKGLTIQPILAICLPGEKFSSTWVAYWTTLLTHLGGRFTVSPIFSYSSNVHVTRACLAHQIVNSIPLPDLVLWIDDDNLLSVDGFEKLCEALQAKPEADMVAGWSWVSPDVYDGTDARSSVGMFDENGIGVRLSLPDLEAAEDDLIEVEYSGFPAVLMRGELLEKAGGAAAFLPVLDNKFDYGFASEDVSFCIHARAAGARIFVDRRVRVPHLKLRDAVPHQSASLEAQVGHEFVVRKDREVPKLAAAGRDSKGD